MGTAVLVEPEIKEGKRLIQSLDRSGLEVAAAFWFYLSESSEWRLMLATPLVDRVGPQDVYSQILEVTQRSKVNLSLQNVSVISPKNPLVRALQHAIRTGRRISGRFSLNVVNNVFIEDAYIYRL